MIKTRWINWWLVALLVVAAGGELRGRDQVRPAATVNSTGTGRIAGVVVDANKQPVRSAVVKITATELPMGRAAITDDAGAFSFEQLPAGRFSLSASKAAYLTVAFGAVRLGGAGTPIALAAGASNANITLTMPHGGVIGGIIRDKTGAPIPGIQVTVSPSGAPAAGPRPGGVMTDDRGAYRAFGLAPGTYLVSVTPGLSGGIGEVGEMSTAEVDAALARLRSRAPTPSAPGPPSQERTSSSIVRPSQAFSPAPIYFPGTASSSAATPIVLGLGEVRDNVDVVYQLARSASVTGTISGAGGQNVRLTLTGEDVALSGLILGGPMLQRRASQSDGEFAYTSVTPGRYTLYASTGGPVPGPAGLGPSPPSSTALFAKTTVDVTGDDIGGVALGLRPTIHVSGRVAFQGSGAAPALPPNFVVRLVATGAVVPGVQTTGSATVKPDGTFQIDSVIPAAYRVITAGEPAGWKARSAMLGGRDLMDVPLDVAFDDVNGVDLVMSDQRSQIAGRLTDTNGAAASGFFVVAFASDRSLWLPGSRRVKSVRPDSDGGFRFDDLPRGEYYLAALTDAESSEWQTPESLAQIAQAAVTVKLAEGGRTTQDLRIRR